MSRVDFFRDIGLDVETALILDDELSTLPARTQRVFEMRARGYGYRRIERVERMANGTARAYVEECEYLRSIFRTESPKNRTYTSRGEDAS